MKRITSLIAIAAAVATTIMACGKKTSSETTTKESVPKVLVAYFSATGNTKAAAEKIAGATGAELFEIKPTEAYSAADLDWKDPSSRCCRENDDPKVRPGFVKSKESLKDYDIIFLGFPIWWNGAPRIINTFVETYNLKGKRVVMFATSGGSGIEKSEKTFKGAYPDVEWEHGKLLNSMSGKAIGDWANGYLK